jgi:hypothetical protein
MRTEMTGGKKLNMAQFNKETIDWEDNWVSLHDGNLPAAPEGNSVTLARELWDQYGEELMKLH